MLKIKPHWCLPLPSICLPFINMHKGQAHDVTHCFNPKKFSLLVVGPTECGKAFFVEKILTMGRIIYEWKKPRRIWWYYSQWQGSYRVMQSSIGKEIQFIRGLPEFKEDLREIDPKFNNVLVFDDVMAQATDSRLASLLGLLKGDIEMLV